MSALARPPTGVFSCVFEGGQAPLSSEMSKAPTVSKVWGVMELGGDLAMEGGLDGTVGDPVQDAAIPEQE